MRTATFALVIVCAAALMAGAAALTVEDKSTIRHTWTFADPAAPKEVKVDNIEGSITLTGERVPSVELVAERTIRAESQDKIQEAQQKVTLNLTQDGNTVEAYVDAPWRCQNGIRDRGPRYYGYRVRFDMELKVPLETGVFLRTINDGEIKVRSINGSFDVENINGGVEMLEIGGSGRAYALNGPVKVVFSRNPQSECYLGSLNGTIDVFFPAGLSADIRLKNFNGSIFSDFPVSYLPGGGQSREQRGGKFVYKSNDFFGVRVGNGGPEIKFDSFNGNICIHEKKQ